MKVQVIEPRTKKVVVAKDGLGKCDLGVVATKYQGREMVRDNGTSQHNPSIQGEMHLQLTSFQN